MQRLIPALLVASLAVIVVAEEPERPRDFPVNPQTSISYSLRISLPNIYPLSYYPEGYIDKVCEMLKEHLGDSGEIGIGSWSVGSRTAGGSAWDFTVHLIVPREMDNETVLAGLREFPFGTSAVLERQVTTVHTYTFDLNEQ